MKKYLEVFNVISKTHRIFDMMLGKMFLQVFPFSYILLLRSRNDFVSLKAFRQVIFLIPKYTLYSVSQLFRSLVKIFLKYISTFF